VAVGWPHFKATVAMVSPIPTLPDWHRKDSAFAAQGNPPINPIHKAHRGKTLQPSAVFFIEQKHSQGTILAQWRCRAVVLSCCQPGKRGDGATHRLTYPRR